MTGTDPRLALVPFEAHHVIDVSLIPAQQQYQALIDSPQDLEGKNMMSVIYDGEVIAIGGAVTPGNKLGAGLLFTDAITPRRFLALHNALMRLAAVYEERGFKLFIHIDQGHPQAQRWAELMGFSQVGFDEVQGRTMQRYER